MIKTMAVEITEATYPIAAACLPPQFALIKKSRVLGSYLVINDLQFPGYTPVVEEFLDEDCEGARSATRYNRLARPQRSDLTLVNYWEPKKTFKKKFKVVADSNTNNEFFEVAKK